VPTEEQQRQLRSWAVWEEGKAGQDLSEDDMAEILQTAGQVADQSGMPAAHDWLINLFIEYEHAEHRMRHAFDDLNRDGIIQDTMLQLKMELNGRIRPRVEKSITQNTGKGVANDAASQAALHAISVNRLAALERLQQLRERYPNLRLDLEEIQRHDAAVNRLAANELQIINTNLEQHPVTEYSPIRVGAVWVRMPSKVASFPLTLGPEITRDWIAPRAGHGFPISTIKASWESVLKYPELNAPIVSPNGNLEFHMNHKRIVTNPGRVDLITYFETPHGT
jgi:hypothetical protein